MNKTSENKLTPMMQQYFSVKEKHPDCLLFFRLGDFYEMFFDDAKIIASALGLVLTARGNLNGKPIPMCGIPHHSYENYLARLIKAGHKVAICEQTETPAQALQQGKKIVNRDVVRIVTAGTLTEDSLLHSTESNYLACISVDSNAKTSSFAIAYIDISTGDFMVKECALADLNSALQTIQPSEILLSTNFNKALLAQNFASKITVIANEKFNLLSNKNLLQSTFGLLTLNSLSNVNILACGVLLDYINITQKRLSIINAPKVYNNSDFLKIDYFTFNSLEIVNSSGGNKKASLRYQIDETKTAMGSRLLAKWLFNPLKNVNDITKRLNIVEDLHSNYNLTTNLTEILKGIPDAERVLARISFFRASINDLYLMRDFLRNANNLKHIIFTSNINNSNINNLFSNNLDYSELLLELEACLLDFLPADFKETGFFKPNYDAAFFKLKTNLEELQNNIVQLQYNYATKLDIPLKINYLNNFGYCIEVSNKNATKMQANDMFIYKGSTSINSRYITAELQELQEKYMFLSNLKQEAEKNIFTNLVNLILQYKNTIVQLCSVIANIDVLVSFAVLATNKNLVKPVFTTQPNVFNVVKARHLVVEDAISKTANNFVANDCIMDNNKHLFLITGPNMGGKSTFLRQNALIVLLAHIGCFVPAQSATLSPVDALFSRVGASDDLFKGQSTFMVEMLELSYILNNASANSFIILDEIGRGTSTYDGVSIAWSTLEYLHNNLKARCLFATHYYELLELQNTLPKLQCYYAKTIEEQGKINFMYLIAKGFNAKSYGIKVAELAGLPKAVVNKANDILMLLEHAHANLTYKDNSLPLFNNNIASNIKANTPTQVATTQLTTQHNTSNTSNTNVVSVTLNAELSSFVSQLASLQPDEYSPKQALESLYSLVTKAQQISNTNKQNENN